MSTPSAHPFAPGVIYCGRSKKRLMPKPTRWIVRISAVVLSFCAGFAIGLVGTAL